MPQTKVEKKFFRIRVGKNCRKNAALFLEKLAVVEFQEVQINIAGGAE